LNEKELYHTNRETGRDYGPAVSKLRNE